MSATSAVGRPAPAPFETVYSHALRGERCTVRTPYGASAVLPVGAWTGSATPSDRLILRHCAGATIDVGCGPGRMTAELVASGHPALGVDVVPEAVRQTRQRGCPALRRDVHERLPGEGRWDTVLLADGNIGIGGDPVGLLTRAGELLASGGRVVAEIGAPGTSTRAFVAQLSCECATSDYFDWAQVGADGLAAVAREAGLVVRVVEQCEGRWCAVLGADR